MKTIKIFLSILLLSSAFIYAQQKKVYIAYIEDEIDLGLAPYISRAISDAEKGGADAIIFKINTFGGRVDAATQIKDAILDSRIPTVAFINNRAISAGALIAISCQTIIMAPGSSIGAATVVDQAGEKVSEKYQSYMRSEMRATAERNGRRTDVAEAMVDERVIIKGLVDSSRLVTLTSEEALEYGFADTLFTKIDDVLEFLDLKGATVVRVEPNWAEDVVRFLNYPLVASLLMMIGFFGLFAEVKTPGWGVPGTAGIIALALFFGSAYILQLATIVEILMFIAGLILIASEIFIIPGFGIAGISGMLLVVLSLFLSLIGGRPFLDFEIISMAIIQLAGAITSALILILILAKFLPKSAIFNKLVLSTATAANRGYVSNPDFSSLVGKEGIALTTLRPAGTAEIDGQKVDVVSDSEYIKNGTKIKVIKTEGMRVVVIPIKEN
ncbi:MAG: nodulation protein NfeD [Ignavibacteriaceae bacterium]|nr:nodulation protein NfeD [Ignavibacteriaceae bacterium]